MIDHLSYEAIVRLIYTNVGATVYIGTVPNNYNTDVWHPKHIRRKLRKFLLHIQQGPSNKLFLPNSIYLLCLYIVNWLTDRVWAILMRCDYIVGVDSLRAIKRSVIKNGEFSVE